MSLHKFAEQVAANGRGDDSLLVHMTPDEVQRLQAFAEANGRTMTINPETGLPEAGFLSDLFKAVAPIALGAFLGPAGAAIGGGFMSAGMAGLAVGGITTLATGSLSRGLMAGLGAYGGAGLGESLMNAGTGALSQTAGAGLVGDEAIQQAVGTKLAAATPMETLTAGFNAATATPSAMGAFAKQNLGNIGYAASPILAGSMVPTTTEAPKSDNYIRQFDFNINPDTGKPDPLYGVRSMAPVKANEFGNKTFQGQRDLFRQQNPNPYEFGVASLNQPPQQFQQTTPMATGGIVALAEGGAGADAINKAVEVNKYFKTNPDVAKAYEANTYGLTPQQFAQTHYERYGQTEQRAPVGLEALVPTTLKPVDTSATDVQGDIGFTPHVGNAGTTPPPVVAPAVVAPPPLRPTDAYQVAPSQSAAATQYLKDNPDVASWLTSEQGKAWTAQHPEYDAQDIAWTHYKKFGENEQRTWGMPKTTTPVTPVITTPQTNAPAGTTNPYGNATNPGDLTYNADGTITVTPNIPYRPYGGFRGIQEIKNAYTQGGGSLGYTSRVPQSIDEFNQLYNKQTGDSQAAYNYLMGKGANPIRSTASKLAMPYDEFALGKKVPSLQSGARDTLTIGGVKYNLTDPTKLPPSDNQGSWQWNAARRRWLKVTASGTVISDGSGGGGIGGDATSGTTSGTASTSTSSDNNVSNSITGLAGAVDSSISVTGMGPGDTGGADGGNTGGGPGTGAAGDSAFAYGGMPRGYAVGGGLGSLGSYSDGGRLLKGPGDGVSDSIPATIGRKQQPARLADGEFVIPARIVSELGNGSTDAGAKKLYAMMDRVQRARGKTTGKNKVAANSRSDKYLPA